MKSSPKRNTSRGFTLPEVLVTIVVVAALSAVGGGVAISAIEQARMTTEMNAARNLAGAWATYAADHGGEVLVGYRAQPGLTNLKGEPLTTPVNARYPWKLAPYVGRMDEAIVFNGNEELLDQDEADYRVSVSPNLGINAVFVGGHYGTGSPLPPSERMRDLLGDFVVTRVAGVYDPSKLIVFASARSNEGRGGTGYYEVRPPRAASRLWAAAPFDQDGQPSDHGFVDFRWKGRAVVAMAAGNVQLLGEEEMRDMRRWSNQAARENDADYAVTP